MRNSFLRQKTIVIPASVPLSNIKHQIVRTDTRVFFYSGRSRKSSLRDQLERVSTRTSDRNTSAQTHNPSVLINTAGFTTINTKVMNFNETQRVNLAPRTLSDSRR